MRVRVRARARGSGPSPAQVLDWAMGSELETVQGSVQELGSAQVQATVQALAPG